MSESVVAKSSDLTLFNRMDARFHVLHEKHKDAFNDLMTMFTRDEIIALAKALPFNSNAAECVIRGMQAKYKPDLDKWLDKMLAVKDPRPHHYAEAAIYAAAAMQHCIAKGLEEMLEIAKKKLEILKRTNLILESVKRSPALIKLAKGEK